MNSRRLKGTKAEGLAVKFLEQRGLQVITRNYQDRHGELDILAREGGTLCVIEVRSRDGSSAYLPEASLSPNKLRHLRRTTQTLLQKLKLSHLPVRLDLIVIDWQTGDPEIRYYPGGIIAPG